MAGHRVPRALITLPDVPVPADSGRRLRSAGTLIGLSERFELDVVLSSEGPARDMHVMPALANVRRTISAPPKERTTARAGAAAARGRLPWTLAHQDWSSVRETLRSWTEGEQYDLVWFGAVSHGVALRAVVSAARQVIDYDDVQTVKWHEYLSGQGAAGAPFPEVLQRRIELPLWRRIERTTARSVDAVVVADPDDLARCSTLGIHNAHAVPNSYPDPGLMARAPSRGDPVVVFVANFAHDPNRAAAVTLIERIVPLLRRSFAGATLRLIGRSAELLAEFAHRPGVDLVGPVDEVRAHVADATATLMPITFGGGTRLKALEAFALGVPVVSTEFGVAGLGSIDGVHFLRAETPEAFVARTIELFNDRGLAKTVTSNARALYETGFTTAASTRAIEELITAIA